ncbi:hypothetical protein AYY19_18130 [Photobacterium aquimaris]|uniref:hypothetical protein n=1 Tax=Photobacterium aquimaris TaxID=512643 RepID=UPI0007F01874|nr:hypothetical protein [Photobacterium aquimaris]OBU15008.1 hypothetical protein AYY19_18130 [Photobacterium aquimaris]PSV96826.1 hypothetical protein CTM91_19285 [Photobacterium aquimaris]
MSFDILGTTLDCRTKANVIYCKCTINEYLKIVGGDFENFSIQRKRENHKAYKRLKDDLRDGALLPSITLAVKHHLVTEIQEIIKSNDNVKLKEFMYKENQVDILDGLQRTYIISDLKSEGHDFPENQEVLLEFWVEQDMSRLIYRMIVLNAGQKAMSMRHQVELLFLSLKKTIEDEIVGIEIFVERDNIRRTQSQKYSLSVIASAYQAFLMRSTELDKNNVISKALVKETVMDASEKEHTEKFNKFIELFKRFKTIDQKVWVHYEKVFDEARFNELSTSTEVNDQEEYLKLKSYKNVKLWLGSENVIIAIFCAMSQFVNTGKYERIISSLDKLNTMLEQSEEEDPLGISNYEKYKSEINPRKYNVGNATRKLLLNGFKEYFRDEGDTPFYNCWEQAAD